eukprot:403354139
MNLNFKSCLFQGLSVLLTCWAVYQIIKLKSYVDILRNEAPECTQGNTNTFELMIGVTFIQICVQYPVQRIAKMMFSSSLPMHKFPLGSKIRHEKAEMIAERVYKFFMYTCSSIGIFFVLKQGNFLHKYLMGNLEDPQYFVNYPCVKVPKHLDDVYVLKLSYHLYELCYSILFHRDRRDFPEYILHHIITMVLILFSYSLNMLTLGAVIMFVADFTDCFVSLFKITADVMNDRVQFVTAAAMIISWTYFRIWFFPSQLMTAWYIQSSQSPHYVFQQTYVFFFAFLCGLQTLHIFWLFLMLKGILNRLTRKSDTQLILQSNKTEKIA